MNFMHTMNKLTKTLMVFSLLIGSGSIASINTAHADHESHVATHAVVDNGKSSTASEANHDNDWYCPMHPQVHQHEPGKCPICKMKLIKPKPKSE